MKQSYSHFFILSLIAINVGGQEETFPDFVQLCHRSDPNLEECVVKSIEHLRPFLIKGIPELGLPALDPFEIPEVVIFDKAKNGVEFIMKNIVATGGKDFQFSNFRYNQKDRTYQFDIFVPKMNFKGEYTADGKILSLLVKGHGSFEHLFTGVEGRVKMRMQATKENGVNRLQVKKLRVRIHFEDGRAKIGFDGDKVFGDAITDIINDNLKHLSESVIPIVENMLEDRIKKAVNAMLSKLDYDKIFPE